MRQRYMIYAAYAYIYMSYVYVLFAHVSSQHHLRSWSLQDMHERHRSEPGGKKGTVRQSCRTVRLLQHFCGSFLTTLNTCECKPEKIKLGALEPLYTLRSNADDDMN